MNMRKFFAGVAAAATLLGGLALGAATANAAETTVTDNATFTFKAESKEQFDNAKLTAYKLVDYVNYGTETNPVYGVKTVAGVDRTKLRNALTKAGFQNVPTDDTTDLMAWAMNQKEVKDNQGKVTQVTFDWSQNRPWQSPSVTRKFADALLANNAFPAVSSNPTFNTATGDDKNGWTSTTTLPQGLYLFLDTAASTSTMSKAVPMIVGSGTVTDGKLALAGGAQVDLKNTKSENQKKSANATDAYVGQTIAYTLSYAIPDPVPDGYTLAFNDVPSKGLTVDFTSLKVTADTTQLDSTAYGVESSSLTDGKGDGTNKFVVTITNPSLYAGKTITVTYNATVTKDAEQAQGATYHEVWNKLVDNNGTTIPGTEPKTKIFSFDFTKVNA
ncbi:collagen-binding protein [Bifidobacterium hapali]|uniref:Collagen-binding protein n=1 Tax=Bifidobacterium hapali TaxID=1630172 RepID=A0A261G2F9_9BIFI|nr:isopeptide-forming domain-containing fimbrial protein [Bifidobacterium hapali]OZG65612.1 collagen-binding protein [Bifidobacterium hapali]